MCETNVVPRGKLYQQLFDAQAHLSLSLHEGRRRRYARERCLSANNNLSSNTDTASEVTTRQQLSSGRKPVVSIYQDDHEDVRGLPDIVVSAKTGSNISERLLEKKQSEHIESLTQLQRDLTELSEGYELLLKETGEEFTLTMSEYDDTLERLMQKTENVNDLEAFSYKDLQDIWTSVSQEFSMRRNYIQGLDELFVKSEIERGVVITAVLKQYTKNFEKISYVMPSDVHRIINNEAMMINQALLANRRALAKLKVNLMEKDLQKELLYQLRWETKLQDWKKIKVTAAVSQFNNLINSPEIQNPKNVQDTLNIMRTKQKTFSDQRLQILQQVRNMTPPNCSKSTASKWYSSLSSVNEQIDGMHSETMTKLCEYYENTWQNCALEVERFKHERITYGFTSDEMQDIVNSEIMPLIGKCQTQAEKRLEAMEKAFKVLATNAAFLSKTLFEFVQGAANIWEVHSAGLQRTEQQLQQYLQKVRNKYYENSQKNEAHLDVMMDRLRQESTEETLKASLQQIMNFLEEIKEKCINLNREELDAVERYPVIVLKEVHAYSIAVSQYFNVNEVYSQDPGELQMLYPLLNLDASRISCMQTSLPQDQIPISAPAPENTDYISEEIRDSENNETFTTAKGNIYSCPEIQCDDPSEKINVMEVEAVLYPKRLMVELRRDVRKKFFNHLEQRNQEVLNYTVTVMETQKKKLKSELDLRLHLHQPRAKRMEIDIHNVRAAELILHQDRVDRHCKGIVQALSDLRTDFNNLQVTQHKINEDFCTKIYNMQGMLYIATKSDRLVKLSASLEISLSEHMNDIQELQRQFRQKVEIRFESFREANAQFLKKFKLFTDGGNFTPKEIDKYRKHLEKMAEYINSADEALMMDMEGTESKCLAQAKEVISKFNEKLQFLKVDLIFLEKIQRVLTNTQVHIKSEVMKSNSHKKWIDTLMSNLREATKHSMDNRIITPCDIFGLITSLLEELRKRSQYLDCYLDHSITDPLPDMPLQAAFAVDAQQLSQKQEKLESPEKGPLLQPSCMGVAFMDDKAVDVIKGLLKMSKPQTYQEVSLGHKDTNLSTLTAGSVQKSGKTVNATGMESLHKKSAESVNLQRKFTEPTRPDKKFYVFGTKPEEQMEINTFMGMIINILQEANELLLQVAEDFYKKKERRSVSCPQYIQETFELCAEDLNKRLLVYHSQSFEYHRDCIQEYCKQLKTTEEIVCEIAERLLTKLRDQHLDHLSQGFTLIHQQFDHTQQLNEQKMREHMSKMCARLSHPACEEELNMLVTAEDYRQEEQMKAIEKNRLELQICIEKNIDDFVATLATLTEKFLCQLDNILTVDEIQFGPVEPKRESITTLIRGTQKKPEITGLLVRESKVWPGITYSVAQQKRETATITTAKNTSTQKKVIEFRNALHQSYEQRIMKEFLSMEKFRQKHKAELLRWKEHWRGQLMTLPTLNSE